MNWELIRTNSGDFTVSILKKEGPLLLHSKYDPVIEAKRWLAQWDIEDVSPSKIHVIGIGAGFHIEQLSEKFPNIEVIAWCFNLDYVRWLKKNKKFKRLERENVTINISNDWNTIRSSFLPILDDPDVMVLVHAPSLELIPDHLAYLKDLLADYVIFLRTVRENSVKLKDNFYCNLILKDNGILNWENTLTNKSIILISAGPSLTKQLPLLKEAYLKNNIFLACVGTALNPLLDYGIIPNAVMISDPNDKIMEQFKDDISVLDTSMFYLATANYKAVSRFQGSRYIVWQKGYSRSEEQALLRGEPQIKTGGSVATCLLDLLIWMGGSRLALVGQDLAFTNSYSHAKGTHNVRKIDIGNLEEVTDFYKRGKVKTSKNLYIYLKWFEKYKRNLNKNVELWNCTEGGAYIEGWVHNSLDQFIK